MEKSGEKSETKPKLVPDACGHGDQSGATPKSPHQVWNRGDPHHRSFVSQPLRTLLAWPGAETRRGQQGWDRSWIW